MNKNNTITDEEIITLARDAVQEYLSNRLYGTVEVIAEGECLKITIKNFGFKYRYTLYDVYWASYYGVSAEALASQVVTCYNKYVQKKFFK